MAVKPLGEAKQLRARVLGLARLHFLLAGAYALYIIVSDAWNLIPPQVVLDRWIMGAVILATTALMWYIASSFNLSATFYKGLVFLFILLDISLATFSVYTGRGMASRGVMLFALPIAVSVTLKSKAALFTTACLTTSAYVLAVMRYFVEYPGEGYRIELYAEAGFFGTMFFVLAGLLWVSVRSRVED